MSANDTGSRKIGKASRLELFYQLIHFFRLDENFYVRHIVHVPRHQNKLIALTLVVKLFGKKKPPQDVYDLLILTFFFHLQVIKNVKDQWFLWLSSPHTERN